MTHGIIEAMTVFSKSSSELNACFPKGGIGVDRGVRIVIKYLEDHPEGLYQPDTALMMLAFLDTYPCRKAKPTIHNSQTITSRLGTPV